MVHVTRALLFASLMLLTAAATAQTTEVNKRCGDAYEQSQYLRRDNRLLEATEQLKICLDPVCPEVASKDCAQWLDEVERATPSVVFRFVDAEGHERDDVSVTMDGEPLVAQIDGSAIAIDPGPHVFVLTPAGGAAVEKRATVAQGEKLRAITVTLTPAAAPVPVDALPIDATPVPAGDAASSSAGVHPMAWVLYGLAAVGVGAFIGFGVHSLNQEAACEDRCNPSAIDDIQLTRILADVSLGVGLLSLGGAIWITVASIDDDVDVGLNGRARALLVCRMVVHAVVPASEQMAL